MAIKAGTIKAFAVASPQRSAALPDVPTTVELGFPGVIGSNTYGVIGPASLPAALRAATPWAASRWIWHPVPPAEKS